jgi:DNA repair protein RadA/Sms
MQYLCRDCGQAAPRWVGRCPGCGEWNTLEEAPPAGRPGGGPGGGRVQPVRLVEIDAGAAAVVPTGLGELDRVMGGGLVASSVTLIAGEPGIGKSTLLLQVLASLERRGRRSMLVSAEESPAQVRLRASRLGMTGDGVWVAGATELDRIRTALVEIRPEVVVVDSIQTVGDPAAGLVAGTPAAVRAVAQALAGEARAAGAALILVGHVTKDGLIAGPRTLEHLVDTVLSFEGDRHHSLRTLRAVKHRFGPVGEVGLWEMTGAGLAEVADGGMFLLADRRPGTPGSCVFAGLEGRRPLLVEVQALVAGSGGPGRRSAVRWEAARLAQLLAVLDRRAGLGWREQDVYVSAVGGIRLADPGADLAVAAALASAATGVAVDDGCVVFGEVGLGGELRQVPHGGRRLAEAARMGFSRAVVPPGTEPVAGVEVEGVPTVAEALDRLLRGRPAAVPRLRMVHAAGGA